MNPQKNQDSQGILDGIQSEVGEENAPLMRFIMRHASAIAGFVLLLLLIIAGIGIWNWYHGGKQDEAHKELARIRYQLKGAERDTALAKLAENAPESVRLFIYLSLGQSAQENGNPILSAEAYAKAAALDKDGALGLMAALNSAGSLLMQAEYAQALALLQELGKKWPEAQNSQEFQQMTAEAASKTGNTRLAREIYQKLADECSTPEKAYFQKRAQELGQEAAASPASSGN